MTIVTKTAIQDIRNAITEKKDSLTMHVSIDDTEGGATHIVVVPNRVEDNVVRIVIYPCNDIEIYQIEGDSPYEDNTLMSVRFGADNVLARAKDGIIIDTCKFESPMTGKQLIDKIVSEFEPNLAYLDTLHVKGE